MIYFLQTHENQPIKIGTSGDPNKRRSDLQTGNPYNLKIIAVIDGDASTEQEIHKTFERYKVPGTREWFYPVVELLDFLISSAKLSTSYTPTIRGDRLPDKLKSEGSQWIEEKMIPKKLATGKVELYGPYRYLYRWDTDSKKRVFVKYLGKAAQNVNSGKQLELFA